jgi:hypothetical protein
LATIVTKRLISLPSGLFESHLRGKPGRHTRRIESIRRLGLDSFALNLSAYRPHSAFRAKKQAAGEQNESGWRPTPARLGDIVLLRRHLARNDRHRMKELQHLRTQADALDDVESMPEQIGDRRDIFLFGVFGQIKDVAAIGLVV